MLRTLDVLAESRYPLVARRVEDYLKASRQKAHAFVAATDRACAPLKGEALTEALTGANRAFMDELLADTRTLLQDAIMAEAEDSPLSFDMDENL